MGFLVRVTGLEPVCSRIRPSNVRVCQFHHTRTSFFYLTAALVPQQQDLLYRLFSALSIPKIKFRTLLASALIFIMQAVVNGDSQGAEEGGIVVVIDNQFIGIAP